jgi:hypothetical protein
MDKHSSLYQTLVNYGMPIANELAYNTALLITIVNRLQ